jgi:hypothetical protein
MGAPMSLTYLQAVDAMQAKMKTAWDLTTHPLFYQNVAGGARALPEPIGPWARMFIEHLQGFQATLGGPNFRRFRRRGNIIVQIFVPSGEGLSEAYTLGKVVTDAFEGQDVSGIWFRNAKINEIGPDGNFFMITATVDFEYDEIR